jgi:hypothetical protein
MNRAMRILTVVAAVVIVAAVAVPVPAHAVLPGSPVATTRTPTPAKRPHPHRKPWPVVLTVRTLPALPGIRLSLDGVVRTTDAKGVVSWTQQHNFSLHVLTLLDSHVERPDRRYQFARWAGQRDPAKAFRTTVAGLPMRRDYVISAAFTVQYPVQARFTDEAGNPIDQSRITSVQVKSDTGQVVDFPTSGPIWLDGSQPLYNKSVLEESDITYSLQSIMISGTNVVDAGRQKFVPATGTVTFVGQLHDLTVRAHDVLFGGPIGQTVRVTYPDGTVVQVPFGPDHSVTLAHLPRGVYQVSVITAGMALSDQFTLSRDRRSDIAVLSRTDLVLLGGVLLALAVGLLIVGRARLRRFLRAAVSWPSRQVRRGWTAARVPDVAARAGTRWGRWIPAPRVPEDGPTETLSPVESETPDHDPERASV